MRKHQRIAMFAFSFVVVLSSLSEVWAQAPKVADRAAEFDVVIETDVIEMLADLMNKRVLER